MATAFDALVAMFAQFGLEELAGEIAELAGNPDLTDAQKYTAVYDLPSYKQRFPAMAELRRRGEAIDEGTYIQQERSYRDVLIRNGLPTGFYDTRDDFAKWMVGAVSPDELNKRVSDAKRIIDSADSSLKDSARDLYGLDTDHLLAYVIDPSRAQPLIDKQMRAVEAGAAANRYGFALDRAAAESLVSNPLNENLDPTSLSQKFGQARDLANTDERLSAIEGTSYNKGDAVDAVLNDNYDKQMKSRRRAEREAGRFGGSSGIGSKSLRTNSY